MIRTAHALLLIASLLACPFRCAGVVNADVMQSASCSCCVSRCEVPLLPLSETGPIEQTQDPLAPSGECTCSNCLCKGAVLTEDDLIHDAVCAALWVVAVLPQLHTPDAGDSAAGMDEGKTLHISPAGRPLRLILQSLQI